MNRLSLCKRIQIETGVTGTLSTTINQSGMFGRLVGWCDAAYEDIQNRSQSWAFLRTEFSFTALSATAEYTASAAGIDNLGNWKTDSFRIYLDSVNDEQWMSYYPWTCWRDYQGMGANRTVTGPPTDFTVKPDKSLALWPIPNDDYTVNGEYYRKPHAMTANADEPLIPEQFQLAIVWRAVMFYAADQEAMTLYQSAEREFKRIFFALQNDQLPMGLSFEALA